MCKHKRNYRAEFQKLVEDAIKDGWAPMWNDLTEGNDILLKATDNASNYFYFHSPEEVKEWK